MTDPFVISPIGTIRGDDVVWPPIHVHGREGCRIYVGITAREAVIAAYAQVRRDYNTWDYERRYGALVVEEPHGWRCGEQMEWRGGHS